jgi:hypothetical protein
MGSCRGNLVLYFNLEFSKNQAHSAPFISSVLVSRQKRIRSYYALIFLPEQNYFNSVPGNLAEQFATKTRHDFERDTSSRRYSPVSAGRSSLAAELASQEGHFRLADSYLTDPAGLFDKEIEDCF